MPHTFPTNLLPAGLHGAREGPENIRSKKAQKDVDLLPDKKRAFHVGF